VASQQEVADKPSATEASLDQWTTYHSGHPEQNVLGAILS